jgi:N6-adenosine-specific RNA methylase IME4
MEFKTHKFANIFPMMEKKDFDSLKKDIQERGYDKRRPIILFENKILDGRNRYKVCEELKVKPFFIKYKGNDALYYVISNNLNRRHLNESQRAMVGIQYKKYYVEKFPAGGDRKSKEYQSGINSTLEEEGKNRDRAGRIVGVSGKMIDMAESIEKEATEKEIKDIKQGNKKVSAVYKKYKIEKQKREIKKLIPEKEIQGVYDVIVIDPPWNYDQQSPYDPQSKRGTVIYPTMTLEELKKIKLPMAENCVVWLWVTNSMFKEALQLTDAFGLIRKTILTWDKQIMGVGSYLRNITEHCILCFRGNPCFQNTKWTTLISEKRTTHSVKPEIFYKMVEEICVGRKLDYFARKKRDGWDVYGDEVK